MGSILKKKKRNQTKIKVKNKRGKRFKKEFKKLDSCFLISMEALHKTSEGDVDIIISYSNLHSKWLSG